MDRTKRSAVAGLPDDILVEILSRVSVKDLHRSKCVSKAWCGLVTDPLHRKELPQTLHGFFYGGGGYGGDSGSDGEDEDRDRDGGEDGEEDADDSDIDIDTEEDVDDEEEEDDDDDKNQISPGLLGSCNGLLLFGHDIDLDCMGFIVCNPATEQWAAVPCSQGRPPTDWHLRASQTYLVFDPAISSHFHLVMFLQEDRRPTVHAYHSKTGAWSHSDIDWTEEERKRSHLDLCYLQASDAAVVNGMLYLILEENQIFQVDFEGKTRGVIPAPSSIVQGNLDYTAIFVGQSQGRLHCVNEEWGADDFPSELSSRVHIGDADDYTLLSIWVLDDNGTQQWVLKHSVSLLHLFGKLGESGTEYSVVAIHPDRNLVFIVQYWNWQLISYDMDSKEVCALGTLEHECSRVTPFVPCFLDFLSN
ncbi:uncharacterized protein [Miscanthus floridulus]|uniref:uncharacterized protein n=1 Tax=Miscanthus floridulus TaxID=154761 RepID=UPI003459C48C